MGKDIQVAAPMGAKCRNHGGKDQVFWLGLEVVYLGGRCRGEEGGKEATNMRA